LTEGEQGSVDVPSSKRRAGAVALSLLSVPLNGLILRALADGPMRLSDLRREVGGPAQTTLRGNLANLAEIGVLAKRGRNGKPSVLENELTPLGSELLLLADAVEAWLSRAPVGPVSFENAAAKASIKALAGGWDSAIIRALAARPLTLTELDRLIDGLTYPALERRLGAMRLAEQIELCPDGDRKRRPYTATPWLREAMGPLTIACRCERRHMAGDVAPIGRIDVESLLLLAAPLLRLSESASGTCQLWVESGASGPAVGRAWGARFQLNEGRVVSCIARVEAQAESSAAGPVSGWLDGLVERDAEHLTYSGDVELGREIVYGLHDVLFPDGVPSGLAAVPFASLVR
jgi:DNA-binding HxlR family transcriptional regulator